MELPFGLFSDALGNNFPWVHVLLFQVSVSQSYRQHCFWNQNPLNREGQPRYPPRSRSLDGSRHQSGGSSAYHPLDHVTAGLPAPAETGAQLATWQTKWLIPKQPGIDSKQRIIPRVQVQVLKQAVLGPTTVRFPFGNPDSSLYWYLDLKTYSSLAFQVPTNMLAVASRSTPCKKLLCFLVPVQVAIKFPLRPQKTQGSYILVPRPKTREIPETMVCDILLDQEPCITYYLPHTKNTIFPPYSLYHILYTRWGSSWLCGFFGALPMSQAWHQACWLI